jgi:2',3'-cyclic-nucleotide 2'-phosphodiesterase (5'-nucleotidase family)
VDSSALGNHEFDLGPTFLSNYFSGRKDSSWNLAANLRSETGQQ